MARYVILPGSLDSIEVEVFTLWDNETGIDCD